MDYTDRNQQGNGRSSEPVTTARKENESQGQVEATTTQLEVTRTEPQQSSATEATPQEDNFASHPVATPQVEQTTQMQRISTTQNEVPVPKLERMEISQEDVSVISMPLATSREETFIHHQTPQRETTISEEAPTRQDKNGAQDAVVAQGAEEENKAESNQITDYEEIVASNRDVGAAQYMGIADSTEEIAMVGQDEEHSITPQHNGMTNAPRGTNCSEEGITAISAIVAADNQKTINETEAEVQAMLGRLTIDDETW